MNRDAAQRMVTILARRKPQEEYLERLPVSENGRILFVRTKEIDWIEANANYARLHAGAHTHEIRETLGTLERKLDPHDLLRIHRSTIVSVLPIKEI
jgi:two-component system LytT family response regulator